jgi:hypothetical protein
MKKILIAMDIERPDLKGIEFGIYLSQLSGAALTGIFLERVNLSEQAGVKFAYGSVYVETIDSSQLPETISREQNHTENIRQFEDACSGRVAYNVKRDFHEPIDALVANTRFADLLVVSPALFSSSATERPSAFIKNVLAKSECPVILSPFHFHEVKELYFACDTESSSMFAIKQFTYLFPELRNIKLTILQASENADFKSGDLEQIKQYLAANYREIVVHEMTGKPDDELFDYLLRKTDAVLVMGAYGRSKLSNFFSHSTADPLIEVNALPLFITHHQS